LEYGARAPFGYMFADDQQRQRHEQADVSFEIQQERCRDVSSQQRQWRKAPEEGAMRSEEG